MSRYLPRIAALALAATLIGAGPVRADSWSLPSESVHESASGDVRLVVVPRELENQLRYFEDAVDDKASPGQKAGSTRTSARARLERRGADGAWSLVWEAPLLNDVAPVDVVVADGGRFVATFDNWHSMGFGKHVVVVYDGAGTPLRTHSLEDFLPRAFGAALPRSVSSLQWRGDPVPSDDGESVILPVVVPSLAAHGIDARTGRELDDDIEPGYVALRIDGSTGAIAPVDAAAWRDAQQAAAQTLQAMLDLQAAYLRFRRDPLFAPDDGDDLDWEEYLEEAHIRSALSDRHPRVVVLSRPGDAAYAGSLAHLAQVLDEPIAGRDIVIGSPDEANLVAALARNLLDHRQGKLAGSRIVVAVSAPRKASVADALRPTGATFAWLDPATGIDQLAHRLPDAEEAAALAAALEAAALDAATEALPAGD